MVLGPLELRDGGVVVPLRRGRPRRLLLSLLLRAGEPVASDRLIEELWGDDDKPKDTANALQVLISYLRKVLEPGKGQLDIETGSGSYRLLLGQSFVDAHHFDQVVRDASGQEPAARRAALDAALDLWRGAPFAELALEDFAQADIVRLEERRLDAVELRNDAMLELGLHREALGPIRQLVIEHPMRERFHGQLMVALYRSGRQADALGAFEEARSTLLEELGLDPGPELQNLRQAILMQDPSLSAPAPAIAAPTPVPEPLPQQGAERAHEPIVPPDDTVGRAEALARLQDLLASRRLLTLTGPGGTGKTRLAAELAGGTSTTWWTDLSPVVDDQGVVRAIATATGAPLPSDGAPGAGLLDHLAGREGVLVLDTCEHVVDVLRPHVDALLAHTAIKVLATSRQPLRARQELAWPVPPLGLPDPHDLSADAVRASSAAELFRRRAMSVDASFDIDEANAADIGRICLLLDGLPLAIELAAGHAAMLSPAAIVRLLDDRLRILSSDELPGRQRTLRDTIAWSYGRLDADEASFLQRLSVFAGGFSLEAAIEVAGHGLADDGLRLLLSLANQSLVARAPDDRFRLLDTIRAFASEHLDRADADLARERHAEWYRFFAEEANDHLRGPDGAGWMQELRTELPNLRAALDWSFTHGHASTGATIAASLSWFWAVDGLSSEAERWMTLAASAVDGESTVEPLLLTARGMHTAARGDLVGSIDASSSAVERYRAHGDVPGEANALIYLGSALWGVGRLREAAEAHDRAIAAFRQLGSDWSLAISLFMRARTAADLGDASVPGLLAEALPIARRAGDAHVIAMCLEQRARYALLEGDAELALALATESLALHERIGHAEGTVASLHARGLALTASGSTDEALDLHVRGLRLSHDLDQPGGFADGIESLAVAASARQEHSEVLRLLSAADAHREQRGVPRPASRERLLEPARSASVAAVGDDEERRAVEAGRLLDPTTLLH